MTAKQLVPRPEVMQISQDMWRIVWLDDSEWTQRHLDDSSDGLTYGRESTVYMKVATGNVMEQHYQTVLLHEVLHACLATSYGTDQPFVDDMKSADAEEFFVGQMAPPLMYVLKTNDHVLKYLLSDGTVQR